MVYDEFEIDDEVIDASFYKTITEIKDNHSDYIESYDVSALNIPIQILDAFFAAAGITKYPKVYNAIYNRGGYLISNMVVYGGLVVSYTDGYVVAMYWSNQGDKEVIKKKLKDFNPQYPIIWVQWRQGSIDCLNSAHHTGTPQWQSDVWL